MINWWKTRVKILRNNLLFQGDICDLFEYFTCMRVFISIKSINYKSTFAFAFVTSWYVVNCKGYACVFTSMLNYSYVTWRNSYWRKFQNWKYFYILDFIYSKIHLNLWGAIHWGQGKFLTVQLSYMKHILAKLSSWRNQHSSCLRMLAIGAASFK